MVDELQIYLDSVLNIEKYQTVKILKENSSERTELVRRLGSGNPDKLFIKKTIKRDAGMGDVYEELWRKNQQGETFNHIPIVFDYFKTETEIVVVMEYIEGISLANALKRNSTVNRKNIDAWFLEICEAVYELHGIMDPPIIHRDLKPSNIIISNDTLKLIDFGISRVYKEDSTQDTSHFGTRGFASPEQFGFGQTDVRSDIYSLGMVLYYLFTGTIPVYNKIISGDSWFNVPLEYQKIILTAIKFDPAERYQSVETLLNDFLQASKSFQLQQQQIYQLSNEYRAQSYIREVPRAIRIVVEILTDCAIAFLVLLISFAVWYTFVEINTGIDPASGNDSDLPRWFVIMDYINVIIIPAFMLCIPMLRFSSVGRLAFFKRHPWTRKELLIPLFIAFGFILVQVVIYNTLFS